MIKQTITIKDKIYSRDLSELDLSDRGLMPEDIVDIPYMYNLEILKLDNNNIPNSDVFGKLPKLKELWFDNNGVTTLSFLDDCDNLEVLTLNLNNISDVSPLLKLKKLKGVYLYSNNIQNISVLSNFSSLNELNLRGNPINKEDITKLQETLPNCEISY